MSSGNSIIIIEDDTQEDTISNQERAAKRRRRAEQAQHAPELGAAGATEDRINAAQLGSEAAAPPPAAAPTAAVAAPPPATDCIICMEPYEEGGEHAPTCLKCGHFFGKTCIERWLSTNRQCPTCKARAKRGDIRKVYNLPTVVAAGGADASTAAAASLAIPLDDAAVPRVLLLKEQQLQKERRERERLEEEAKALKQQLKSMEALQALGSTMGLTPQVLQAIELAASSHHLYNPLPMTLHAYGGVLHPLAAGGAAPTQAQAQVLSALSPGLGPAQAQLHTYAAPPGQAMPWPPQPPVPSQQPAHLSNPAPTQQPPYNSYVNTHAQPGLAAAMPLADTTGAAAAAAAGQPGLGRAGADATPPGGQGPGMWGNYSTQQVQGAAGSLGLGSGGGTAAGQRLQPSQMLNGLGQQQQQYQQQQGMGRGAGGLFERAWAAPLCVVGCRVVALSPTGGWLLAPETREGGKAWVTKVSVPCPESCVRIPLPDGAGTATDLQLPPATCPVPPDRHLAALVTRGSGLALLHPRHDSVVATFSQLPHRPHSCAWLPDSRGEHMLVAGLEKGVLALLDARMTRGSVGLVSALEGTGCPPLPVHTVAALPPGALQVPAAAAAAAAATDADWPVVALACVRGAFVFTGTIAMDTGSQVPGVLPMDGGFADSRGMQVEGLAVAWETAAGAGTGAEHGMPGGAAGADGSEAAWRAALSWRPMGGGAGAAAGGVGGSGPGPRIEVGLLSTGPVWDVRRAFRHELTLTGGYTRGTALVRSCFVPPPHTTHTHNPYTSAHTSAMAAPGLLLASTDEASRCPLLWSLGSRAVVQALDPHPMAPTCLAAVGLGQGLGAYGGYDCLLAAASQTQVALYRRRE